MKTTIKLLLFANLILLGVQFGLSLHRSSDGQLIYELQTLQTSLRHENQLIENQIDQLTSITSLAQRAKIAGLVILKTVTFDSGSMAMVHPTQ